MMRRKVVAAVSRIPAETARHFSWRNVIAVLSSKRIAFENTGIGQRRKSERAIS
jgi:hypothetical protein